MSSSTVQSQEVFDNLRRVNYINEVETDRRQTAETKRAAAASKTQIQSAEVEAEGIEAHDKTKATTRVLVETGDQVTTAPKAKEVMAQPKLNLPAPTKKPYAGPTYDPFNCGSDDVSLVAILGSALAAQARSSATLYSSFFQQATQSMTASASLIDPTVAAVKTNWDEQANATRADASKSEGDGWINLGFGGLTFGMGLYGAWQEAGAPKAALNETEQAAADAEKAAGKSSSATKAAGAAAKAAAPELEATAASSSQAATKAETAAASAAKSAAQKAVSKETTVLVKSGEEASSLEKTLKTGGERVKSVMQCLYTGFSKAAGSAAGFQMLATGIAGVSIDSKQEGIKANAQSAAGTADAFSKEGEMYSQYYTQGFNRTEDLRQGAQQNVDLSVNILKSGADTITQAITSQRI
jgi:hypothetical protein